MKQHSRILVRKSLNDRRKDFWCFIRPTFWYSQLIQKPLIWWFFIIRFGDLSSLFRKIICTFLTLKEKNIVKLGFSVLTIIKIILIQFYRQVMFYGLTIAKISSTNLLWGGRTIPMSLLSFFHL